MNKPTKIITHHAVSAKYHTTEDVELWHMREWPGFTSRAGFHVGYHYVIEWDGTVVQCRDHDEVGAHCIGQNKSSIGVCFMGNNSAHMPSVEQEEAWFDLHERLTEELGELPVYPHRAYANKECHGSLLPDDYWTKVIYIQQKKKLLHQLVQLYTRLLSIMTGRRMV